MSVAILLNDYHQYFKLKLISPDVDAPKPTKRVLADKIQYLNN